jgi:hypothetical protein
MADQPGETQEPQDSEANGQARAHGNQGLVFGLLGFGAVACVCVVAVVMAFLFGKLLQPPNISQTVTLPQPVAPVLPTPTPVNLASRDYSGGDPGRAALPADLSNKSAYTPKSRQVAVQRGATYPLPQAGSSMTSSAEALLQSHFGTHRIKFMVRASGTQTNLPLRLRPFNPNAPAGSQATGPVYGAIPLGSGTPPAELSSMPDVEYQTVSTQAVGLRVEVTRLLKTSKTEKYEAVKGLQFLVADLQVTNTTSRDWTLKAEGLEVREAGDISYGADPNLVEGGEDTKLVEGGATVNYTVAFQVPDNVELVHIALETPGSAPLLIPLNKK